MLTVYYVILIVSVALFATILTFGSYWLMARLALLDEPSERSNHEKPIVTGVGIGFMVTIVSFLIVVNTPAVVLLGTIILMILSVMDDRRSVSVKTRLGFQAIAVILALHVFDGGVFQGILPVWLDMPLTGIVWLWMINLTNFMDGIDELTVTQVGSVCLSILLLGFFAENLPHAIMVDALVILVGVVSFYPWNKHPAHCFMGDAGSVPLGYLQGFLLLSLSASGLWAVALILPAYYLTDATVTLLRRAIRKEKIWEAHSEHYYQQAVRHGRRHDEVSRLLLVLNAVLLLLAGVSFAGSTMIALAAVGAAYAFSIALCLYFAQPVKAPKPKQVTHEAAA